jgi:hypothetical protein
MYNLELVRRNIVDVALIRKQLLVPGSPWFAYGVGIDYTDVL